MIYKPQDKMPKENQDILFLHKNGGNVWESGYWLRPHFYKYEAFTGYRPENVYCWMYAPKVPEWAREDDENDTD